MKTFAFLISAFLLLGSIRAAPSVVGTWELKSFTRITDEDKEIPWCKAPHGLLIYAPDGYMSATINCAKDTPADAPSQSYDNRLLYAGTYWTEGEKSVVHLVKNSSDLTLIGKKLPRTIQSLTEKDLILSGGAANGKGRFLIEWVKAKAPRN